MAASTEMFAAFMSSRVRMVDDGAVRDQADGRARTIRPTYLHLPPGPADDILA